jgi:hypothetical protein
MCMRAIVRLIASVGIVVALAACDPTERKYVNEGAGVDLYDPGKGNQLDLLNQYIEFICAQVGPDCSTASKTFVLAGMNDIDLRCDGFLTWLDARRRDREPVLAEIQAVTTAVHSIMTVTGSSPKSLDIATAAFGLASATYNNWNSRMLISVNQSTVQDVVYTGQGDYRKKIATWAVTDRPTAIYLLRNYLRLCMPITIEAAINTTTTLVQRDAAPDPAERSLVVSTTTPTRLTIIRNVDAPLQRFAPLPPLPSPNRLGELEPKMSKKDMQKILGVLGCTGDDLGPKGSQPRKALVKFLKDNGQALGILVNEKGELIENSKTKDPQILTPNVSFSLRDFRGPRGTCNG